jgi:hypothetical protein
MVSDLQEDLGLLVREDSDGIFKNILLPLKAKGIISLEGDSNSGPSSLLVKLTPFGIMLVEKIKQKKYSSVSPTRFYIFLD